LKYKIPVVAVFVVGATLVPVLTGLVVAVFEVSAMVVPVVVGLVVAFFLVTAMVVLVVIVTIVKTKVNVMLFQDDTEKEFNS